ncbi:ribonuclease H-like domain-containing protein [Tanacetum coccineum]
MDLETAQTTTTAKLPILKQGEYDMWRLRIEQYFQVQDYALWDVIENGNSFKPAAQTTTNADGTSTSLIPGLVTTKEKVQKKNDVKARSMLLMALPNEHLMTFNQYKDAKTLFVAMQTRFAGFRRFTASSSSSLSSQNMAFVSSPSSTNEVNTAYRVSTANTQVSPASTQVSTASTQVSTANLSDATVYAFLTSQPNGPQLVHEDLEQIHQDDLEEMDLKWQLALLSMRTRRFFQKTGRKITIHGSDTVGYDKSKVECFNCHKMGHFVRECRRPRNQDNMNRNQDSSRRTGHMADDEVPTNMALMAFLDSEVHNDKTCSKTCLKSFETLQTQLDDLRIEFNKSKFNLATYKRGLASVEEQLIFYKKNEAIFYEQLVVLKRDISYKDSEISMLKSELEKLKQEKESNQLKIENFDNASKSLDKLIWSQITDKSRKGVGFVSYNAVPPPHTGLFSPPNLDLSYSGLEEFQQPEFEGYRPKPSKSVSKDISNKGRESPDAPLIEELVSDNKLEKKTIFPTISKIEFVRPKQQEKTVRKPADCNYHQRERVVSENNYTSVNYNYSAKKAHPSAYRNIVPRAVLMKTGLRSLNTARPINTAHPKTIVYSARPMSRFPKSAQSTVKRPYQIRTALTNKNFSQKVNTATGKFYTARTKTVNTARPNSTVVNAVRANQAHDREHVLISDFKEFNEGYVTFGGGAKGEKITGKGTLKTSKLDFEDVYFVKELQFNLFSVLQMCDKKLKFWQTATASTLDNREMEITATIDRKVKIVTEASIMMHLNEEGSDSDILAPEDPSKQGRKIAQIDEDEGITLVQMGVSTVSIVYDIAAKSLVYIRRSASKTKDKGKGIMEESESAITKTKRQQEQERLGYEAALRLQEQLDEEERQRIAMAHEAASSFNFEEWEDIQARIEADELFEPDANDELWKSQKYIHDITWRLYDTCKVHHVSTKDGIDIYMLVERGYPLSRGVLTQMLVAKLLVEQNNEMSRELLRKIFMQACNVDAICRLASRSSFETLKTQLDDLRIEFNKSDFNLATYKRWLAFLFYKKNELEKLKQEKESNQLKIKKFDNASKSLDKLIGSQITHKSRKGVGFISYNDVLPPPTGLFSPPNLDLSYSGLEEFQQPEFEGYGPKPSKSVSKDTSNEVREC